MRIWKRYLRALRLGLLIAAACGICHAPCSVSAQSAPSAAPRGATAPNSSEAEEGPPEPKSTRLVGPLPTELKVRRARTGHLLVQAQIDGKEAGWFIFDTGAGMSCVDKRVVEKFKLSDAGATTARGNGGSEETRFRLAKSFAVGPVLLENAPVVELDLAAIGLAIGEPELAGVIGYECFLPAVYEVNLAEAKIVAHDPAKYVLPAGEQWHKLAFKGRRPMIPGKIENNAAGEFLIDLGANSALIVNTPTVNKFELLDGRETKSAKTGGVGGMQAARAGKVVTLELCGHTLTDVSTVFTQTVKGAHADDGEQGTVGVGALKSFRCILNYTAKSVALLPK